jgi:hypothetical protein
MNHHKFAQLSETLLLSSEFQELRSVIELREPNLWYILGISRRETLVSSFLAWMLNPQANHSFGAEFLKNFLVQALQTDAGQQNDLMPINVMVMDLSEAIVDTEEWLGSRRCDILIHDSSQGFLCIIENKIGAKESQKQTQDYYKNSFSRFPIDQYPHRMYIYLTPEGDPPQSEYFILFSYEDILGCIGALRKKHKLSETEQFLLDQFQENILRGIAMDNTTRDLAQAIYDKHAEVIEFVIQTAERKDVEDDTPIQRQWDGESWFFNIGEPGYSWDDCRNYGFICAGGAKRYRDLMKRFEVDHVIYAYVSKSGYVGIGKIKKAAVPFRDAILADGSMLRGLSLAGRYNNSNDDETCDWIALVDWEFAVEKSQSVRQPTITRMTTARVYEHRKGIAKKVKASLKRDLPSR